MLDMLMNTVGSLDKLFKVFKDNEDELQAGKLLDKESRKVIMANGNVFRLMEDLLVEPKVLVSDSLKNHKNIYDVIKFNSALFTSVYEDVFRLLVGLHKLDATTAISLMSSGTPGDGGVESKTSIIPDVKTRWGIVDLEVGLEKESGKEERDKNVERIYKTITFAIIVGKGENEKKTYVNIVIRPAIVYVPNSDFYKMVKTNGDDTTLSAAYHAYMSDEKTLSDVLFAKTLTDDYKQGRLTDTDATLLDVENRKRIATMKIAKDGAIGFGLLYQLCIIPSTIKGELNIMLRGKIDKDRIKDKFLNNTKSLTLTIVDDDWEMVSIYINGLRGSQDIPFDKLKDKKGKNDELSDLFKLMTTTRGI